MTDQTPADAQTRAAQLEELLTVAEQAANTAEAVRVELVADNERLRATLAAARDAVAEAQDCDDDACMLSHRCGADHLASIEAALGTPESS